jgi:oxygen-independent coproporphyrinogen-3 oxidase
VPFETPGKIKDYFNEIPDVLLQLKEMENDELLVINDYGITVTKRKTLCS